MPETMKRHPEDVTEAAALAMYGRGYGQISDAEASKAATVANAVLDALDTICAGLTATVSAHRRNALTRPAPVVVAK